MKKHIALFSTTLLFASFLGGARAFATEEHNTPSPNSETTEVKGTLQLSEKGGYNPNPPSKDLNEKTDINENYFGIAYKPKEFNIGTVALADTKDEQNIVMEGPTGEEGDSKAFHIAVKDKLRNTNRGWTLQARLSTAIENENLGITIKTGTKENSVKRNINEGTEDCQYSELINQVMKENNGVEVTNPENFEINTSDQVIMQAENGKFLNAAYDLELPQVELHIPDASKVKAQSLTTSVTWTLSDAPK